MVIMVISIFFPLQRFDLQMSTKLITSSHIARSAQNSRFNALLHITKLSVASHIVCYPTLGSEFTCIQAIFLIFTSLNLQVTCT